MPRSIQLFVVDVDGTLLTPDKELTARAKKAVESLRNAGIRLALTSGRPPRGLRMLIEPLSVDTPLAAFNGGMFVDQDLEILQQHPLAPSAARRAVQVIREHGLDVWVYRETSWYVRDANAPHVARERNTVQFDPTITDDLDALLDKAVKIVGVSDDSDTMARCTDAVQGLDAELYAARSQPYYLDVTHPSANKGEVVRYLCGRLSISAGNVATIGDMQNDVDMFEAGGLSIAMGNAGDDVKDKAHHVTTDNTDEGFARAVEDVVLPRA